MTKPILYEFPPTRSNRAKWALEELSIDYDSNMVNFMTGEQQSAEHRKVHPLGKVPCLHTDSYEIYESVAILLQLIDENPASDLAPALGSPLRAHYYQWCVFSSAELDQNLFDVMSHTMHLPPEKRNTEIAERGKMRVNERCEIVSAALKGQDYILGEKFSGADIAMGYAVNWVKYVGMIDTHPRLVEYLALLSTRPAFQKVFLTQG